GVDREWHFEFKRELRKDRFNAGELFIFCDRQGAGPCRLASDIDDVATRRRHLLRMRQGGFHADILPTVRERIRRQVKNTHDNRTCSDCRKKGITPGALFRAHQSFLPCESLRSDIFYYPNSHPRPSTPQPTALPP